MEDVEEEFSVVGGQEIVGEIAYSADRTLYTLAAPHCSSVEPADAVTCHYCTQPRIWEFQHRG